MCVDVSSCLCVLVLRNMYAHLPTPHTHISHTHTPHVCRTPHTHPPSSHPHTSQISHTHTQKSHSPTPHKSHPHTPTPTTHREGPGLRTLRLTAEDLRTQFRQHTITAALQCSGNKRDAFNTVKEVKGLRWDVGAIGNATWTGVLLRDVLVAAGMREEELRGVEHIQFEGADRDMEGAVYGASIPVHKVGWGE